MVDLLRRMGKNMLVMDAARFDRLTETDSVAPSASYLGICLMFSFLLMSLSFFYLDNMVYGEQIDIALRYALEDAAFIAIANVLVSFFLFHFLATHLFARALGAKKGLSKTFQVSAYSFTPYFLFGWIWILGYELESLLYLFLGLNILISLLAYTNIIIGLKRIHGLSYLRAVFAGFLLPVIASVAYGTLMGMYAAKLGLV